MSVDDVCLRGVGELHDPICVKLRLLFVPGSCEFFVDLGGARDGVAGQKDGSVGQIEPERELSGRVSGGEQYLKAGGNLRVFVDEQVGLLGPVDWLDGSPVEGFGKSAFCRCDQARAMGEIADTAHVIYMGVADDQQIDICRGQATSCQLSLGQVFGGEFQHLAEITQLVLQGGCSSIGRIFGRKSGINEHVFVRIGLDQEAADSDDAAIRVDLEQAVIEDEQLLRASLEVLYAFHDIIGVGWAMKVKIHTLFQYLLETTEAEPEAIVGFSLARSPVLGAFLDELDPNLSLDWNGRSFRGLPELRAHVLAQAGLSGVCTPDDVLITAGAAEANYLVLRQLLEPGDELVTECPGWPQAEVIADAVGAATRLVHRREAEGWALPLDQLEEVVSARTKVIFLSNPNNPTGRVFSTGELEHVVRIADRVGAWLIVDEVYAGLEWGGVRAPSIAGMYERGITTGSGSKALGLQGLRTGWLISAAPDLVMDAIILRENSSEIMNVLGEAITEIALRPDRYAAAIAQAQSEGQANLALLSEFVDTQEKVSWVAPQAGLIGLARLAEGIDGDDFARRLLAAPYRTFLLPGSAYRQPQHIRLGVGGGPDVNLSLGLERVAALLADWRA